MIYGIDFGSPKNKNQIFGFEFQFQRTNYYANDVDIDIRRESLNNSM